MSNGEEGHPQDGLEQGDPNVGAGQDGFEAGGEAGDLGNLDQAELDRQAAAEEARNAAARELGHKSWEDALRAQKEAQRKITEQGQQLSQLRRVAQTQVNTEIDEDDPTVAATRAAYTIIAAKEVAAKLRGLSPDQQGKMRALMNHELMNDPMLEGQPDAVDILYDRAMKRQEAETHNLVKTIFGEEVSLDEVRNMAKERRSGSSDRGKQGRLEATVLPEGSAPQTRSGSRGSTDETRWQSEKDEARGRKDWAAVMRLNLRNDRYIIKGGQK